MGGNQWSWNWYPSVPLQSLAYSHSASTGKSWGVLLFVLASLPFGHLKLRLLLKAPHQIIQVDQEFTLHLQNHDSHRKVLKRRCLLFLSLFLLTEVLQGSSLLCLLSLSSILLTLTTSVYWWLQNTSPGRPLPWVPVSWTPFLNFPHKLDLPETRLPYSGSGTHMYLSIPLIFKPSTCLSPCLQKPS